MGRWVSAAPGGCQAGVKSARGGRQTPPGRRMYTASRARRPLPRRERDPHRRRAGPPSPRKENAHMRRLVRIAPLITLLTVLSCASTSELVRRGEVALDAGNMDRAFDWSRRALDHEPGNPRAREIMTAAAGPLLSARKT